jgi:hypothetical protein
MNGRIANAVQCRLKTLKTSDALVDLAVVAHAVAAIAVADDDANHSEKCCCQASGDLGSLLYAAKRQPL